MRIGIKLNDLALAKMRHGYTALRCDAHDSAEETERVDEVTGAYDGADGKLTVWTASVAVRDTTFTAGRINE